MTSVRDWQLHGVDIKVELATAGELVMGGATIPFPFNSGGVGGAPVGWDRYISNSSAQDFTKYNFTTAQGVISVSRALQPLYYNTYAGFQTSEAFYFPMKKGFRYEIGVDARQMAGKQASYRAVTLEAARLPNGGWTYITGVGTGIALADWEHISATSTQPLNYDNYMGRINLRGASGGSNTDYDWGTQFKDLYIREIAAEQPPMEWLDITCDVRAIDIRYGRERFTQRYDIGSLQLGLLNDDGKYSYHAVHPLNLRPGRQVRVTATKDARTYPMAFGVLDSLTDGYSLDGHVIANWQCVDPTTVLSNVATKSTGSNTTSGNRIRYILDQVGYILQNVLRGTWWMQALQSSDRTLRDEAGVTADSEGGAFYAERDGYIMYQSREWVTTDPNLYQVTADLLASGDMADIPVVDPIPTQPGAPSICVAELATDWSLSRVINTVSLANQGGTAQEFVDEESLKRYGPHTYQRMDFVNYGDDTLAIRAADIMNGFADPVLRVNRIGFAPGIDGEWDFTLGVFLNWLVRVWYRNEANRWGYAVCLHVQSVEHRITPTDWYTSLTVDQPTSFVELEDSEYGWDMGLWDDALWDQTETAGALWSDGSKWTAGAKWG